MATRIMAVLNVTPDSFSDGGRWDTLPRAVAHAEELVAAGADMIDVGGESTRPGSIRVSEEEELRRVVPVIREIAGLGVTLSVDTMRASVAEAALDAGAHIINDVSSGQVDPRMLPLAAERRVPLVLMHWREHLADAGKQYSYTDVVDQVRAEILQRVDEALAAGVAHSDIILDPGLGFAKNAEHNWELMGGLEEFADLGFRLLVAASRKRFLASLVSSADPKSVPEADLDAATAAISALSARAGAWAVRVHEPRASFIASQVVAAIEPYRTARASGSVQNQEK